MKKFAIIGGSFNPVTKAHVEIGQIASKELPGWQIFYIPAPDRFFDIMEVRWRKKRDPVGKKATFAARKSSKATWIFV